MQKIKLQLCKGITTNIIDVPDDVGDKYYLRIYSHLSCIPPTTNEFIFNTRKSCIEIEFRWYGQMEGAEKVYELNINTIDTPHDHNHLPTN